MRLRDDPRRGQNCSCQRNGQTLATLQHLLIERIDDPLDDDVTAFDPGAEPCDEIGSRIEAPALEQVIEQRGDQFVIGCADRRMRTGGEARAQVGQRNRPDRRRGVGDDQQRPTRRLRTVPGVEQVILRRAIGVVPFEQERALLADAHVADEVVIADARDPIALRDAVTAAGGPADVTVVCVDVPGCEGGAILATAERGTVIFFSMATSFSAAALGAEGLAADVRMLVGNGYTPGHAAYALELLRADAGVRGLFERRL